MLALVTVAAAPADARAGGYPTGWAVSADLHASLLTDSATDPLVSATAGYGLRAGHRWGPWGVFLQAEHNMWVAIELEQGVQMGAFNVALGGELIFADGWVRTSLAIGASILLHETIFDPPGTAGFFLDLRPLGVRWCVTEGVTLGLDPITFAVVAPVLGGIPLIRVLYRTHLVATYHF